MGRAVVCECGQRNDLAVFGYGEAKLCLACGKALHLPEAELLVESFVPEVPSDAFGDGGAEGPDATINSFESPTPSEAPEESIPSVPVAAGAPRVWSEGVREAAAEGGHGACARCGKAFRGDWDRNPRHDGDVCHLCAARADDTYKVPTFRERRDMMRPDAPRPIVQATEKVPSKWEENKKGLLVLAACGAIAVIAVTLLPVEYWVAQIFAPDRARAQELPIAWMWVVKGFGFVASALGQGLGLYVTLALLDLLYEDKWDNLRPVIYLGIAFAVMNSLVTLGAAHFGVFGPMASILMVMAFFVTFVIKLLMIAARFPLRLEGGCGFVMAWFLCSVALGPAMRMVEQLLGALVAAIAL